MNSRPNPSVDWFNYPYKMTPLIEVLLISVFVIALLAWYVIKHPENEHQSKSEK